MIKFEFYTGAEVRTVNWSKNGRAGTIHKQECYVHLLDKGGKPKPHPEKTSVNLDTDERGIPQPYAPGVYQLHPASLYLDKFGGLAVAPRLVAVK